MKRFLNALVALATLTGAPLDAYAGTNLWTSGGPNAARVLRLIADPVTPGLAYAGTVMGIFRTVDQGATWHDASSGAPNSVSVLAIDALNPAVVYAAEHTGIEGLYRSTDAGGTWKVFAPSAAVGFQIDAIGVSTSPSAAVYVGSEKGIVRSTDGGNNWTAVNSGLQGGGGSLPRIYRIRTDPRAPGVVYAATFTGLFKSTDDGSTWAGAYSGTIGAAVELLIDATAVTTLYATNGTHVYRSTNAAATWVTLSTISGSIASLAQDASAPSVLFATTLFNGVWKSTNGAVSWSMVMPGGEEGFALAADRSVPATVYVATPAALSTTTDSGATWDRDPNGLAGFTGQMVADPINAQTAYALAQTDPYKTTDGGAHWSRIPNPLTRRSSNIALDPTSPATLYLAASFKEAARSTNAGASWTLLGDIADSSTYISGLTVDPQNPATIYAATSAGVRKSTDAGATWPSANATLTNREVRNLAIPAEAANTLYTTTDAGVLRTTNGGASWDPLNSGLASLDARSLVIAPSAPTTMYLNAGGALYRSTNGGGTWTPLGNVLETPGNAMAVSSSDAQTVFVALAGFRAGVARSDDGGNSWRYFNFGLTGRTGRAFVDSLAFAGGPSPILYASTSPGGVFQMSLVGKTFTVDSAGDGQDAVINGVCADASAKCTLRAAIQEANATGVSDIIHFNVPQFGVIGINPFPPLPEITGPVVIDGYSQPLSGPNPSLYAMNAYPLIQVSSRGLRIIGGNSAVRGLVINGVTGSAGITLFGGNNRIQGNRIGTNADGTTAAGNTTGIEIHSNGNLIGGTHVEDANQISGNSGNGVSISAYTSSNRVQGNYIGTAADGVQKLGNDTGIKIGDDDPEVQEGGEHVIGGLDAGARNVISGNTSDGVRINDGASLVQGNYIGTNGSGTAAAGNEHGITIIGPRGNGIGGDSAAARNLISGNNMGITVIGVPTTDTVIQGNFIGTQATGEAALPNTLGIVLYAPDSVIGGSHSGQGNLVSGNLQHGVQLKAIAGALYADRTVIQGNRIGTNAAGNAALGNGDVGIYVESASNAIGGAAPGERNVISGNYRGIFLSDQLANNNLIQGNYIGTNASGTAALGNFSEGILLADSGNNSIGGAAGAGNVISGNGFGLSISASGNLVRGNFIGTDVTGLVGIGNGNNPAYGATWGIFLDGINRIGGDNAGNIIAFNNGVGVASDIAGSSIVANSIHSNSGLGIDVNEDGVTMNDLGDAEAYTAQNFPVLTSANSTGSMLTVQGSLNSSANKSFTLQFFSNPSCDPSGYGEGQTYLGSTEVTSNAFGNVPINLNLPVVVLGGHVVTATATGVVDGNTSEFSHCVVVTGPTATASTTQTGTFTQTPTVTPTPTITATATRTSTRTATHTPSTTPTSTFTATRTATQTATRTTTHTATATSSATRSVTITATFSPSVTATTTPTPSMTSTRTPTQTPSSSQTPTHSATTTPTVSPSVTQNPSVTATRTQTASITPTRTTTISATTTATRTPTASPTATNSTTSTATSTPTATRTSTRTATSTTTPSRSATATPSASASHSPSPTYTETRTPSATITPTAPPSASATPTATATATPTWSATPSSTPTTSASPSATLTATASSTVTITAPPTPTASPRATATATVSICVGNCDDDAGVGMDDLTALIDSALEQIPPTACEGPLSVDGQITIDDIQRAVIEATDGTCEGGA